MTNKVPSPAALGLPPQYSSWRSSQEDAITAIDTASFPVTALRLPPGAGKSGIYTAWAVWRGKRVLILTSRKTLQSQLYEDFAGLGMISLVGQNDPVYSEACKITGGAVSDGPCHGEFKCPHKKTDCPPFALIRRARSEQIVVTNYAFFMANSQVLGEFDAIIMDEAHAVFDWLSNFVSPEISKSEAKKYLRREPTSNWKPWSSWHLDITTSDLRDAKRKEPKTHDDYITIRNLRRLQEKLKALSEIDPGALIYKKSPSGWSWTCVWPGYFKSRIFHSAKKFFLMSGTISRKTMALLGFRKEEYGWHEYPSTFPIRNRPIYILPAPRMNAQASPGDHQVWLNLIDSFISKRPGVRGIIHTGSYARAEYIATRSKNSRRIIFHLNSAGLAEALARFQERKDAVLVSPSITEGVDLRDDLCRFQIQAKLPFADPRDPIVAERTKQDPEYPWYVAAQTIVQASMRGVRSATDLCETAICDGSWQGWYWRRAAHHFPSWWSNALAQVTVVPPPPERFRKKSLDAGKK